MKKLICVILTLVLVCSLLAACGDSKSIFDEQNENTEANGGGTTAVKEEATDDPFAIDSKDDADDTFDIDDWDSYDWETYDRDTDDFDDWDTDFPDDWDDVITTDYPGPGKDAKKLVGKWQMDASDLDEDELNALFATAFGDLDDAPAVVGLVKDDLGTMMMNMFGCFYYVYNEDGSVGMLVDPVSYRDALLGLYSTMFDRMAELSDKEVSEMMGVDPDELKSELEAQGMTWREMCSALKDSMMAQMEEEFDLDEIKDQFDGDITEDGFIAVYSDALYNYEGGVLTYYNDGKVSSSMKIKLSGSNYSIVEVLVADETQNDDFGPFAQVYKGLKFVKK